MMTIKALLFSLISTITFAAVTPAQAPWVDPNQIVGRFLISAEVRVGTGIVCWGAVVDPDGDLVDLQSSTVVAPEGLTCQIDPNGAYAWTWYPTITQVGIHYVKMQVFEKANGQGLILQDTAIFAIKVNQANRPPVITLGGFTIKP